MEKWNLYNRKGELLDGYCYRGDPLPDDTFCLACEVFIRHRDGDILAMVRSKDKKDFPGKYEFSAGGAALYGESALECVARECLEETGLTPSTFESIAFTRDLAKHILIHTFTATVDCPKDSVKLQEGETEGYRWFSLEEFRQIIKTDAVIKRQMLRLNSFLHKNGWM